jgi:hypothetical protein
MKIIREIRKKDTKNRSDGPRKMRREINMKIKNRNGFERGKLKIKRGGGK